MNLITLNTWAGKLHEPLMSFLRGRAANTDIFCLQEVYEDASERLATKHGVTQNLFSDLSAVLPQYQGYFAAAQDGEIGLAMFIRKGTDVQEMGEQFVHRHHNALVQDDMRTLGKNLQWARVSIDGKPVTIVHFHGLWTGGDKLDTPERIEQSEKILGFLNTITGPHILCGDFNLLPDTKSLALLAAGRRDLIKESGATSTRSHYYTKEPRFADYMLVTPDIVVDRFDVLQDVVSDHLPLSLSFNL